MCERMLLHWPSGVLRRICFYFTIGKFRFRKSQKPFVTSQIQGQPLYASEFEKDGRELRVRVEGQLMLNSVAPLLDAVLAGLGVAYLLEGQVQPYLADGRLVRVLADWCPP
jgi:DNA-binding transcriptional LysR family regulator